MSGPLSSIKMLDFSTLLPGPYATMMLADMGADILWVDAVKSDIDKKIPEQFLCVNTWADQNDLSLLI